MRSHYCGALGTANIDETVTLCGWVDRRRDHGGVIFLDMRDRQGIVQVVFDPDTEEHFQRADRVRSEYVLRVTGRVRARSDATVNPAMATGQIEVLGKELEILNQAATPPFQLDEYTAVGEEVRLQYRYMDLRRHEMQQRLILRSKITSAVRNFLDGEGFLDIETPILTRATPEGARDYLVPSRTHPGKFFALPQSPQLFKQLLMVGGVERYFQIARCYRDEDFRAALVFGTWGPCKQDVQRLIEFYGVAANVDLFEAISQTELSQLLNQSKVNVLLSLKEGGNRSTFEGFFSNTPCIVLRNHTGLNKERVNDHTGMSPHDRTFCAVRNVVGTQVNRASLLKHPLMPYNSSPMPHTVRGPTALNTPPVRTPHC